MSTFDIRLFYNLDITKGYLMGLFNLLFGNDDTRNHKHREQELANMYEFGWDEPEETKCDKKALQREKWANYEYSDEE